jgi:MFS family permease
MYKGWKIVAVGFLSMAVYSLTAFGMPVFVKPVTADLQWSRTAFMIGISLHGFFSALGGLAGGVLLDRLGGCSILTCGAIVMALALEGIGAIHRPEQFYVLCAILGLGLGLVGQIPVTAIVSRWFDQHRGLALAIAMCGITAGGFAAPISSATLINAIGWRSTLRWLGLITLLLVPCVLMVVREPRPGEVVDGSSSDNTAVDGKTEFPLRQVLRTRAFWVIFTSFFFVWFYTNSVIAHLVAYLADSGYTNEHAARALSAMLGLSVLGKFIFGPMADRIGAFSTYIQLQVVSFITLSPVFMVGFVLAHGLGLGGFLVLSGLVVSRRFGVGGGVFGAAMLSFLPASILAPIIPARFYDLGWGYKPFFVLLAVCNFFSILLSIWMYVDSKQLQREKVVASQLIRQAT